MAHCVKCENGMVTEVDGAEVFKWRCGCKSAAYWENRQAEKKAWRDSIIRKHVQKVGV